MVNRRNAIVVSSIGFEAGNESERNSLVDVSVSAVRSILDLIIDF